MTPWREAPESHDLESTTRHYSSPLLLDRAPSIEWRAFGGAEEVTIEYVNTLDGPLRRIDVPTVARAGAREPDVVTRAEWGADESLARRSGGCTRTFYPAKQLFVHHTVTSNYDPNPSATVRAIYHFHTQSRGWCDIGYNFLIGQNGQVFEGRWAGSYRPWEVHDGENDAERIVTGAHVSDFNSGSIGISILGNYQKARLRDATRRSLVGLLAWEADRHNMNPRGWHVYRNPSSGLTKRLPYIAGHRDAGQTDCPGRFLYRSLRSIRRSVNKQIGDGKVASVLRGEEKAPIPAGQTYAARFRLTRKNGEPLANKRLAFYKRGSGAWTAAGHDRTDEKGLVVLKLEPKRNVDVAAYWTGDSRRWGDEAVVHQGISPVVSIGVEGAVTETAPDEYTFDFYTDEVFIGGSVKPDHADRKVLVQTWQEVAEDTAVQLDDRRKLLDDESVYRARQAVPPEGGTFLFKALLPSHDDHATGKSRKIKVIVPPPLTPPLD